MTCICSFFRLFEGEISCDIPKGMLRSAFQEPVYLVLKLEDLQLIF